MPLSAPAPRKHLHTRHVECRGYAREDGLWDIEGHITDIKTYAIRNRWRTEIAVGEPVHEMWLRVTLDSMMVIQAIEAVTDFAPFAICPAITENFQRLKGLRIAAGFTRKVKERLGGVEGCTHLVELLGPLATTAFQTMQSAQRPADSTGPSLPQGVTKGAVTERPLLLDSCHAFAADGMIAREEWPDYFKAGENR